MITIKKVQEATLAIPEINAIYRNGTLLGYIEKITDSISWQHPFVAYSVAKSIPGKMFLGEFYQTNKSKMHAFDLAVDKILKCA